MQPQQLLQLVSSHLQQQQQLGNNMTNGSSSSSSSNGRSSSSSSSNGSLPTPQQQQQQRPASPYAQLLTQLDAVAAAQIEASLTEMTQLSEMAVARVLSAQLPAGTGLFLGNSMPIRDMDMYAGPRASQAPLAAAEVAAATISSSSSNDTAGDSSSSSTLGFTAAGFSSAAAAAAGVSVPELSTEMDEEDLLGLGNNITSIGSMPLGGLISGSGLGSGAAGFSGSAGQQGLCTGSRSGFSAGVWGGCVPEALVGVPVAANRGASGIDGVLSTAAGEPLQKEKF
jgi:hypothetical protein